MTDIEKTAPDGVAPLQAAEAATGGREETVTLTRAELMGGIIVGIGGEHDPVPTQAQVDRAVDQIFRYARRRDQHAAQPPSSEASPHE